MAHPAEDSELAPTAWLPEIYFIWVARPQVAKPPFVGHANPDFHSLIRFSDNNTLLDHVYSGGITAAFPDSFFRLRRTRFSLSAPSRGRAKAQSGHPWPAALASVQSALRPD
jgi:hypothetical protein